MKSGDYYYVPERYPMTTIYLTEPGSVLSKQGNKLIISKSKEKIRDFPIEKVEAIVLVGSSSLSSGLMVEMMQRDITMTWLSNRGKFFGRLEPTSSVNIERQILQFDLARDNQFAKEITTKWIRAKIKNSITMLQRWSRERSESDVNKEIVAMKNSLEGIDKAESLDQIRGYEGNASRNYFNALKEIVSEEFKFKDRNRMPPKDPFNSLLSFAYTLLMYEVYTAIKIKGLNPYMGVFHQPRRGHPSLASDLMEEWRPILCESLVINCISHKLFNREDFEYMSMENGGGVYLKQDASKKFIAKFEERLRKRNKYLDYIEYPASFRESIAFQVGSLVKAIESKDSEIYRPIIIR